MTVVNGIGHWWWCATITFSVNIMNTATMLLKAIKNVKNDKYILRISHPILGYCSTNEVFLMAIEVYILVVNMWHYRQLRTNDW